MFENGAAECIFCSFRENVHVWKYSFRSASQPVVSKFLRDLAPAGRPLLITTEELE